jgi:S-adenosylmethionine/arginine decarboxylase-like enzyme
MKNTNIQHHHMLIRMETIKFPEKKDVPKFKKLIKKIISDINMKILGGPFIYYLDKPVENKGITGICSIETSHLSFHIWETPEPGILQNSKSNALMQFDVYTCGNLTKNDAKLILEHLSIYLPTRIDVDILDRKKSLKMKYHNHWNDNGKLLFDDWIQLKF